MSGSIAVLFQRLTQGVYVVGVAHGAGGRLLCPLRTFQRANG